MPSTEKLLEEVTALEGVDLEEALDPAEPEGVYRDSRQCAALAIAGGKFGVLLSPPTPRPKKG
ncbi:hypothetical protein GTU99_29605 [Streptomyces sp. PRKS01-65]|nr:hypothetical protein [Streptomyces harenosi]NEY36265.1 hypothetical protein [Streptomyces harenosi]